MGRRLTWDAAKGLALWNAGWSLGMIALELGKSKTAIATYAAAHDWPERSLAVRITAAERARIVAEREGRQKPARNRALVVAKWERRKMERRHRDRNALALATARQLLEMPGDGRPRQDFGRRDAAA